MNAMISSSVFASPVKRMEDFFSPSVGVIETCVLFFLVVKFDRNAFLDEGELCFNIISLFSVSLDCIESLFCSLLECHETSLLGVEISPPFVAGGSGGVFQALLVAFGIISL